MSVALHIENAAAKLLAVSMAAVLAVGLTPWFSFGPETSGGVVI